ncbi:hypothetical protein [Streptomyces sp. AMCC400023]|uniref:hypothetical protein n=1 Tax=Streptomyces sp. AMCC400023 TaxID=2056258 RepID=UPI001F31F0B5|nr:hypothetical protein [Streptomyces sp. AMCC400023]UJV42083.1 hypothetical protein CVT30_21515 [Streptomyces sp. AMCC400023]
MATLIQGPELRSLLLGNPPLSSPSGAFAADTRALFTVTGGEVLITALWGKVTTAITVANTVALQTNPTTGDTKVFVEATDIGTNDTAVGTVVGFTPSIDDPATSGALGEHSIMLGGHVLRDLVVTTGDIEQVTTGTNPDGAITWYATWVPLSDGARLVAS